MRTCVPWVNTRVRKMLWVLRCTRRANNTETSAGRPMLMLSATSDGPDGKFALLIVCDEGVGIPQDDVPHVFDRFHRGANVVGRFAGTGLGLSSARELVEMHGGTISVESGEGKGSTFVVRLPLTPPAEATRLSPE